MWPAGFDPARLTRDASLNKLIIREAPGSHPAHVGQNGGDLLGRDAVVRLIQQRCGVEVPVDAVADRLIAGMTAGRAREAAADVVREVGDRLGSLVATLRDPATAEAATGGRRTYLQAWQGVELVTLGGGLMKGLVGETVAARVGTVLGAAGLDRPVVQVASHPEWLALVGAARSGAADHGRIAVFDCGQTAIKRGIAVIDHESLAGLHVLPPSSIDPAPRSALPAVVRLVRRTLGEHQTEPVTEVILSVASYVHDGRPIRDNASIYAELDPDGLRSGIGMPARIIHDGSAAWRGTDTDIPSAVIMLGTWLGVGIGPHRERPRPYAADFAMQELGQPKIRSRRPWPAGSAAPAAT